MVHTKFLTIFAALLLLEALPLAWSHRDDHGNGRPSSDAIEVSRIPSDANATSSMDQSYFTYPCYGTLILAHVMFMTIAWLFVLPIGVMLSVSHSRLALVVQLGFLGLNSVGLLLGTVYTNKTPDLYENNAHSKIGWIVTWIVAVQCVIGFIKFTTAIMAPQTKDAVHPTYLPISTETLARHDEIQPYRYSNDSGHFTASHASRSQSVSCTSDSHEQEQERKIREYQEGQADAEADCSEKQGLLANAKVQYFASRIVARLSKRTLRVLDVIYNAIDCTSLLLGFFAILSGAVVYGGVFRGNNIFNGLAHSVKGGIFFWYGLLTLGRWMGCFAEIGWAWNIKPPVGVVTAHKARIPSAEFVESFVIFLYGASNVWLEHLAAWGSAWSAQDLEHVSISIMFFGGGLCGMLVESKKIRDFLNTSILMSPAAHGSQRTRELLHPPKSYQFSLNPFPGLIILLLGLMMSSHHQSSMISTTIHKQWGMLFVGFALARAVTYILIYVSPPTSYLPSRPPSELISSFCLISGGLVFIASNKDAVAAMERYGLHAMFPFTITMGFTAFLMAWAIIVLAVKGWTARRYQSADHVEGVSFS